MNLASFLDSKPLYYKEIDYDRFPATWDEIKSHFCLPKIIHIIGTNGKGSTGRFLAHYLLKKKKSVGHYSSPHILHFNERIWLNGENISKVLLEEHHQKLQTILSEKRLESLSYFEYTTLLAISIFEKCDYIILEAGLGGEHDATSVFENDLTLVTPIGMDHESFLGDTIEKIAKTKLRAVRKFAIVGVQEKKIYKLVRDISRKQDIEFFRSSYFFTKEERGKVRKLVHSLQLPDFFIENVLLAMAGAKFFGFDIKYQTLSDITLFGRCQKIKPNITIDVGHNPLAAKVLLSAFKNKKIHLIYNSYSDKDYLKILEILTPVIKIVEILPIYNQRAEEQKKLEDAIHLLGLKYKTFDKIDLNNEYLVFGSFAVVEEFLKYHVTQDTT